MPTIRNMVTHSVCIENIVTVHFITMISLYGVIPQGFRIGKINSATSVLGQAVKNQTHEHKIIHASQKKLTLTRKFKNKYQSTPSIERARGELATGAW